MDAQCLRPGRRPAEAGWLEGDLTAGDLTAGHVGAWRAPAPSPARRTRHSLRTTPCPTVDVSVRELRNHTARVVAAVESGEPVVLTVHGRPVADIVAHRTRSERRPSDQLLADLAAVSDLAKVLGVRSPASDFDGGLTTDDLRR